MRGQGLPWKERLGGAFLLKFLMLTPLIGPHHRSTPIKRREANEAEAYQKNALRDAGIKRKRGLEEVPV